MFVFGTKNKTKKNKTKKHTHRNEKEIHLLLDQRATFTRDRMVSITVSVLAGIYFGFIMFKAQLWSPIVIRRQYMFEQWTMMKV